MFGISISKASALHDLYCSGATGAPHRFVRTAIAENEVSRSRARSPSIPPHHRLRMLASFHRHSASSGGGLSLCREQSLGGRAAPSVQGKLFQWLLNGRSRWASRRWIGRVFRSPTEDP